MGMGLGYRCGVTAMALVLSCAPAGPPAAQVPDAHPLGEAPTQPPADNAAPLEADKPSEPEEASKGRLQLPSTVFLSVLPITVRERAQKMAALASDDESFARSLRVR